MMNGLFAEYMMEAELAEGRLTGLDGRRSQTAIWRAENERLLREARPHKPGVVTQVLLRQSHSADEQELREDGKRFGLAVAEFDGFLESSWGAVPGAMVGVIFWEDRRAMEGFRHSEVYARFRLSPSAEGFVDKSFPLRVQNDFSFLEAAQPVARPTVERAPNLQVAPQPAPASAGGWRRKLRLATLGVAAASALAFALPFTGL
jgi:hypothetical protein